MRGPFACVAAVLVLAGCGTIPEQECATVNWYDLGLKDGRAGYPPERVAQHRDACKGVKVEPDELAYLQGRKAGLGEYCQPANAFRDGLAGNEYHGQCDDTFARNHAAALRVATLRRSIERNRGDVSWREAEIRSDRTSDSRRAELRSQVRELQEYDFTSAEALHLVRICRGANIVGADVVEVLPDRDPQGITALLAAHVAFEILCLDACRRAEASPQRKRPARRVSRAAGRG